MILSFTIFKTLYPKPLDLGSWNFERTVTSLHLSHVTCHVSPVTCHVSRLTCHMSHVTFISIYIYFFCRQSGETSRWRVCFQWGLPRLVVMKKSRIRARLGPLVLVWFKSTNTIPWVQINTMSHCQYYESMSIPWVIVNTKSTRLYIESMFINKYEL